MSANIVEWDVQLINERTMSPVATAGTVVVMGSGDPALPTLYADENGTSKANPFALVNGRLTFYTAATVTAVDLSIFLTDGTAFFIQGLTQSQHRACVIPEKHEQVLILPYTLGANTVTIVDTGFDLPAKVLVKDCFIHPHTSAGTAALLNVGVSSDVDGFIDQADISLTAITPLQEDQGSAVAGMIGALLASVTATVQRKLYQTANSTSGATLVYQNSGSITATGKGYIYLTLIRIPTAS